MIFLFKVYQTGLELDFSSQLEEIYSLNTLLAKLFDAFTAGQTHIKHPVGLIPKTPRYQEYQSRGEDF